MLMRCKVGTLSAQTDRTNVERSNAQPWLIERAPRFRALGVAARVKWRHSDRLEELKVPLVVAIRDFSEVRVGGKKVDDLGGRGARLVLCLVPLEH